MKSILKLAALVTLLSLGSFAFAEGGGSYASHDSMTSGSATAAAGTTFYNTVMKPKTPLPVHGGDDAVIRQTLRNKGAGQGWKEAYNNAVMSESGASQSNGPTDNPYPQQRQP